MDLARRFFDLFKGNDRAHGTFSVQTDRERDGKKQGVARVLKETTTIDHWSAHIGGKQGLGIIPIKDNNCCHWGAIDIDVYNLDHKVLISKIKKLNVPGVLCRSKSGGAHLFFFFKEELPASVLQPKLRDIASLLGYAGSEIFPKQTEILVERGDTGNFLNMPYFMGEDTTRYGFNRDGVSLGMSEFLDYANSMLLDLDPFLDIETNTVKDDKVLPNGPPCLQHLCSEGFGEGSRNNALFSLGVYARLSDKQNWENTIQKYNMDYMKPPLPAHEVATIIKQLQKREYYYKCDDQPLVNFCNKSLCITRKYGVGPGELNNDLSSLTKIDGDPPIWLLNVDGSRVELSTEALVSQLVFQRECVAQVNKYPISMSAKAWQTRMQVLLNNLTIIEVPPDATLKGAFEDLLFSFCCDRAKGTEREDILQGIAVWTKGRVYFQIKDVMKHLAVNDFKTYTSNRVALRVKELGAEKMFWQVKGKGVHVWGFPEEFFGAAASVNLDLPERKNRDDIL